MPFLGKKETRCSGCQNEYARRWRKQNPDRVQASNQRHYEKNSAEIRAAALKRYHDEGLRFSKYGLTAEDFLRLYEEQEGRCAICEAEQEPSKIHIDHNHETGEVRGLLCGSCNRALGYLKDSPLIVERAFNYLTRKEQ